MPAIHPTAIVSSDATLADDVIVGPFAVIEGAAVLEKGVTIGGHAWITGDVVIGEGSHIGWGSIVGADPQDLSFEPATKSGVRIGRKNTLREYVTIHRGSKNGGYTTLGESNFLMTGVHLAHDVHMGDHNVIANNVLLAGHIHIGNRVFLGGGAGFHQFIKIGDFAISQGNAAISQDIPPYHMVHGQNQLAGLNVIGLRRNGFDSDVRAAIKSASKLLFFSGHPIPHALELAAQREWPEAVQCLIDSVKHPSRKGVMTQ